MENLYLSQALSGKNNWWRYVVGVLLILVFWQAGAFIVGVLTVILHNGGLPEEASPVSFLALLASFAFLLLGTWGVTRLLHGRSVRSLTTPFHRVSGKRILVGAGFWLLAMAIVSLVEALLYPGRYVANPDLASVLPYLLIALVFVPLQTTAEEYFFRGYLLQASGRLLRQPIALSVLNGLLFALPHLANPEVAAMGLFQAMLLYALIGFFFAYITLRSQTIELALGTHAANNFFTAVFANYKTSALPTSSSFTIQTLDPAYGLISLSAVIVVVLGLFSTGRIRKWLDLR